MSDVCSVSILVGGDVALQGAYDQLARAKGGDIFGDARELMRQADLTICNLETPVCEGLLPIEKAGPSISAAPETLRALTEAGTDAVCLANNHIFDYGSPGLLQTFSALREYNLRLVGAGFDRKSAEQCLRVLIGGKRISIFSFAEREFNTSDDGEAGAALLDPLRMGPLLISERASADAILVCVHGGNEFFPLPRPGLRRLCQFIVDMGADAVIGHHPHVAGPYEIYRGKPIVYSVGNLIFDHDDPPEGWNEGYFANLTFSFGNGKLESVAHNLVPFCQAAAFGGLRLMHGQERNDFIRRIEVMRDQLESRPHEWLAAWDDFVARREAQATINLFSPLRVRGLRRLMAIRAFRKLIVPPSRRLQRLNMLRCDSHREVVTAALQKRS